MDAFTVSNVMNDEYAARIMVWAIEKPRTASEMSESLGIPISACYNLLKCVEMRIAPSGKRISVYQSQLRKASIFLDRGEVRVKMELVDGRVEDHCLVQAGERAPPA